MKLHHAGDVKKPHQERKRVKVEGKERNGKERRLIASDEQKREQ